MNEQEAWSRYFAAAITGAMANGGYLFEVGTKQGIEECAKAADDALRIHSEMFTLDAEERL